MTVPTVAITSAERYVHQKGLTKDAACAIISVLYAGESGLNPGPQPSTSHTDKGGILFANGAMGIASWNGSRQKDLANFAARKGESSWALNTQLDFVLTECANSYRQVWAAIKSKYSYETIIKIFVEDYENPHNPQQEIERALTFARDLYPHISDEQIPPQPPPTQIQKRTSMPQEMLIQLGVQLAVAVFEGLMNSIAKQSQGLGNTGPLPPFQPPVQQAPFDPQDFAKILAQELAQVLHPTQPTKA